MSRQAQEPKKGCVRRFLKGCITFYLGVGAVAVVAVMVVDTETPSSPPPQTQSPPPPPKVATPKAPKRARKAPKFELGKELSIESLAALCDHFVANFESVKDCSPDEEGIYVIADPSWKRMPCSRQKTVVAWYLRQIKKLRGKHMLMASPDWEEYVSTDGTVHCKGKFQAPTKKETPAQRLLADRIYSFEMLVGIADPNGELISSVLSTDGSGVKGGALLVFTDAWHALTCSEKRQYVAALQKGWRDLGGKALVLADKNGDDLSVPENC